MNSRTIFNGLKLCHSHKRSYSILRKHITEFGIETSNYTVIDPVLGTNFEKTDFAKDIPKQISRPKYVLGMDEPLPYLPIVYDKDQIHRIRVAASIAAHCVRLAPDILQPGSTTLQLNDALHQEILSKGAYPSILGFRKFPKSISTSVNNVACHGIPDDRPLEVGDLVSVDVNVFKDGFHGVCGTTVIVGQLDADPLTRYLRSVAEELLFKGISACKGGGFMLDIGAEISKFCRKRHVKVIPTLTGHGVGEYLHTAPDVYHVTNDYFGQLRPGTYIIMN